MAEIAYLDHMLQLEILAHRFLEENNFQPPHLRVAWGHLRYKFSFMGLQATLKYGEDKSAELLKEKAFVAAEKKHNGVIHAGNLRFTCAFGDVKIERLVGYAQPLRYHPPSEFMSGESHYLTKRSYVTKTVGGHFPEGLPVINAQKLTDDVYWLII